MQKNNFFSIFFLLLYFFLLFFGVGNIFGGVFVDILAISMIQALSLFARLFNSIRENTKLIRFGGN